MLPKFMISHQRFQGTIHPQLFFSNQAIVLNAIYLTVIAKSCYLSLPQTLIDMLDERREKILDHTSLPGLDLRRDLHAGAEFGRASFGDDGVSLERDMHDIDRRVGGIGTHAIALPLRR